jgi:hypothetical protein
MAAQLDSSTVREPKRRTWADQYRVIKNMSCIQLFQTPWASKPLLPSSVPSSRGACAWPWHGALLQLPAHTSLLAIADLIAILGC